MKLKEILTERITDVVFHGKSYQDAYEILKTNTIPLATAFTDKAEQFSKKEHYYYMSLARSRTSSFYRSRGNMIIFKMDGRKLSHNYSGKGINYYKNKVFGSRVESEHEDRLFTDKPKITNATSYILEAYIMLSSSGGEREIIELLQKRDIPFKVYKSSNDFVRNGKPIPSNEIEEYIKNSEKGLEKDNINPNLNSNETINATYLALKLSPDDNINQEHRKVIRELLAYNTDIGSEFKNARQKPEFWKVIRGIQVEMKRNNLRDVDSLKSYLIDKWKGKF